MRSELRIAYFVLRMGAQNTQYAIRSTFYQNQMTMTAVVANNRAA